MARPALRIEVTTKDQKALRKLLSGGVQQVRVVLRADSGFARDALIGAAMRADPGLRQDVGERPDPRASPHVG